MSQEPNDLSFSAGEVIEIIDETNADWWTGRCRGRQGLFPSNHVEKIPSTSTPVASPLPPPMAVNPIGPAAPSPPSGYQNEKPVYRPFGAAYHGNDGYIGMAIAGGAAAIGTILLASVIRRAARK